MVVPPNIRTVKTSQTSHSTAQTLVLMPNGASSPCHMERGHVTVCAAKDCHRHTAALFTFFRDIVASTFVEYFERADYMKEQESLKQRFFEERAVSGTRKVHTCCAPLAPRDGVCVAFLWQLKLARSESMWVYVTPMCSVDIVCVVYCVECVPF